MIRLTALERHYEVGGEEVRALDGVTLEIPAGDYVAIMGPSGSGKSTLLNVLGCLDRATGGSYVLDGKEVAGLDDADLTQVRRHKIGFIFQAFHLIPRLTAAENVETPLLFAGVDAAERRARALEALKAVGLADRAHHRPAELSGGQQQRVAIARAMVTRPAILLADEPTGNLDTHSGADIMRVLEDMNRAGLTLLVVTHDPAMGNRAHRIVRLVDGKVAEDRRTTQG